MANSFEFSVRPSGVVSMSDTHAMKHSIPSYQSMILITEDEKLSSPSGHAVAVTTEQSGSSNVHQLPMTEQNIQLLSSTTSQKGSVVSSACLARRYEIAKAIYESAQARQEMLQWAADDTAAGSQAGSVGCHSTDISSDTESHGPSLPSTAQEYPPRAFTPHRCTLLLRRRFTTIFSRTWDAYFRCL
jgi:hypothetical protein